MSSVKKATVCAVCIALCCVLPAAFHMLGLGGYFSPMHFPVLLCGLLCGWPYGLFCGIAGPLLSSVLFAMPLSVQLIYMIPEHLVYGFAAGLLFRIIRTGNTLLDCYAALIPAMLLGRVVGGAAQAVFYQLTARAYTFSLWVVGFLVGTIPGVAAQLLLLPLSVLALTRAKLIPQRYKKEPSHES